MRSEEEIKEFMKFTNEMMQTNIDEYNNGEKTYNEYIKQQYNYKGWYDALWWVLEK